MYFSSHVCFLSYCPHSWDPLSRERERGLFRTSVSGLSLVRAKRGRGSQEGEGIFKMYLIIASYIIVAL